MARNAVRSRLGSVIPAPLRRARFRQLWLGMASSYAGDRFQQLAQAWLVATLTSSALAVGWIATLGSIPLLFMPLGGVIADLVDRRRLLITWQMVGAAATTVVAILVLVDRIAVWHVYAWAVINSENPARSEKPLPHQRWDDSFLQRFGSSSRLGVPQPGI